MAAIAKQVGGRALSYLSVTRGRPPAFYESGHGTTIRYPDPRGIALADSRVHLEVEDWIRQIWMPDTFGQPFFRERLQLESGGLFDFDAVSADRRIAASISASGGFTASGKAAVPKLNKLRSDVLFLLQTSLDRRLVVLADADLFKLCEREIDSGRMPRQVEFFHAPLPDALEIKLRASRAVAAAEVSPGGAAR